MVDGVQRRVVYVVTSPMSAWLLLRGQLTYMREQGFEVHLVCSPGPWLDAAAAREGVFVHRIPMRREIAPLADLVALGRLFRLLRRLRPQVTNVSTPKAGLLAGLAAALARVPSRVYVLRGLRVETASGFRRRLLSLTERVACACADRVVCVSPSLREKAVALGLVARHRTVVIGAGSSNGVDLARFEPTTERCDRAFQLRRTLGIPKEATVLGFFGRFTLDKGIIELAEAFRGLEEQWPEARLLLLGDFEGGDSVPEAIRTQLEEDPAIVRPGFVQDAAPYYHVCDLIVLPTHREGFPNVLVEAAAAGKPVVTTSATGAVDAVLDGKTGLVVDVGNAHALRSALARLLEEPERAEAMGAAGRQWATETFAPERVWAGLATLYREVLLPGAAGSARVVAPAGRARGYAGGADGAAAGSAWSDGMHREPGRVYAVVKRALDLAAASLGLVVLLPVLGLLALSIRLRLGSPVLFRQRRPGLRGRPFTLLKFRTMTDAFDASDEPLPDGQRLTPFGRALRSLSLDELPTLVNVLRGEMSLVGPRPLLMEYLERYTEEQARRHEVLPGITGWAQVNGRNAIPWSDRLAMDVWYVDHRSLRLDMEILARTVFKVLRRDGISAPGEATVSRFTGSEVEHE